MASAKKKILIVDEEGFSRVCSAILNSEGYQTSTALSAEKAETNGLTDDVSLIVSSYPYAVSFLKSREARNIPTIVLSDEVNNDLIDLMKGINRSVCLVKPLDFERFKYLVRGIIDGRLKLTGRNIIA
ncbi:MAG: DNA-binding response regulator [Nitrospiraceae bacterium]|nr:MAG: DNA-binding response regulator [Nitrospiraceae bacterium]